MSAFKKMLIAFCIVAIFACLGLVAYTADKAAEKCISAAKYKPHQTVKFRGTKVRILYANNNYFGCFYVVKIDGGCEYISMSTLENESITDQ